MKRIAVLLVLIGSAASLLAADAAHTFYIQLVRGTDTAKPPQPGCHQAGPRLAATFRPVFSWKHYWAVRCRPVPLRPGEKRRLRLGSGREVEIDLGQPKERKITTFRNGKVLDRTISPAGDHMTIIGDNREAKSAWFVVVRPDKPKD